jgi:hypothetical protein
VVSVEQIAPVRIAGAFGGCDDVAEQHRRLE